MPAWLTGYLAAALSLSALTLVMGWANDDDDKRSIALYTLFLPVTGPLTPIFWCAGIGWGLVLLVRFLWRTAFPPPPPDTTRKPDGGPYR